MTLVHDVESFDVAVPVVGARGAALTLPACAGKRAVLESSTPATSPLRGQRRQKRTTLYSASSASVRPSSFGAAWSLSERARGVLKARRSQRPLAASFLSAAAQLHRHRGPCALPHGELVVWASDFLKSAHGGPR